MLGFFGFGFGFLFFVCWLVFYISEQCLLTNLAVTTWVITQYQATIFRYTVD